MIDFRNTKIRILSEEHSKAFQDAVFAAGGKWCDSGEFYLRGVNFIFANDSLSMSLCDNAVFFEDHDYNEIHMPTPIKVSDKLKHIESLPVSSNMTTFETAKVGDRVWCMRSGWGEVQDTSYSPRYPISVRFQNGENSTYTLGGFFDYDDISQSLFLDKVKIEAVQKTMPVLQVDAKVYVWDNGYENGYEHKVKRHFSHFENGDCHTFDLGHTSWTGGSTTAWDNWELAEK